MRLVPRFSLRFLLLALTVFLIVFGVGVKYWRENEQHKASVERLLAAGWAVEEEPVTLWGYTIGMKLTGLVADMSASPALVQSFLEVPTLRDLRGFGIGQFHEDMLPMLPEFLDKLAEASALERLHLVYVKLSDQQLQRLGEFSQLRILDLRGGFRFTNANLRFLERLACLETLDLDGNFGLLKDVTGLRMPRLKFLKIDGVYTLDDAMPDEPRPDGELKRQELYLTCAGWGRFPCLETLDINCNFTKVVCEPGSLPILKHLVLTKVTQDSQIDWPQLVAAVPRLEAMAVHYSQVNTLMLTQLKSLSGLRMLWLDKKPYSRENEKYVADKKIEHRGETIYIPQILDSELTSFLQQSPQIQWFFYEDDFWKEIYPAEYQTAIRNIMRWHSEHWNPRSRDPHWHFL